MVLMHGLNLLLRKKNEVDVGLMMNPTNSNIINI